MNSMDALSYRYATAFLSVFGKSIGDSHLAAYESAAVFLKSNPAILSLLSLPHSGYDEKKMALSTLCTHFGLPLCTESLVELILDHGRIILLAVIFCAIADLYRKENNKIVFTIESSHELDENYKNDIEQWIAKQVKAACEFIYTQNHRLIAGIRIISVSYGWEQSVAQSLRALSATFRC